MSQQFFPTSFLTDRRMPETGALAPARPTPPRNLASTFALWHARSRQRRHLRELAQWDARLLDDIGVSRDTALREAAKPFWRK